MKSRDRRKLRGGLSHPSLDGYPVSPPATESIRLDPERVLDVFQRFLTMPDAATYVTDEHIEIRIPVDPLRARLVNGELTRSCLWDFPGLETEETSRLLIVRIKAYPGGILSPEFEALTRALSLHEKWRRAHAAISRDQDILEYQLSHPVHHPSSCLVMA